MVELLEDPVDLSEVDLREGPEGRVRHRPPGPTHGRFLAALAVRLGRAPVDVVPTARVDAAHVDALDRACLGALEARLALERAPLVVQQLEAAAELVRDVETNLGIHDGDLRLEESPKGERHALDQAETRDKAHRPSPLTTTIAPAVTNRLTSDAGSSHFQAKSISWSIRTRGRVPRIHTNVNTNV